MKEQININTIDNKTANNFKYYKIGEVNGETIVLSDLGDNFIKIERLVNGKKDRLFTEEETSNIINEYNEDASGLMMDVEYNTDKDWTEDQLKEVIELIKKES